MTLMPLVCELARVDNGLIVNSTLVRTSLRLRVMQLLNPRHADSSTLSADTARDNLRNSLCL